MSLPKSDTVEHVQTTEELDAVMSDRVEETRRSTVQGLRQPSAVVVSSTSTNRRPAAIPTQPVRPTSPADISSLPPRWTVPDCPDTRPALTCPDVH
jgi:hypothetical protein